MAKRRRYNKGRQAKRRQKSAPFHVARRRLMVGVLISAAGLLIAGAWYQQVMRTDFLQQKGNYKHISYMDVPARRGRILDRNGEVLAVSNPVDSLWADPRILSHDNETVKILAQALKTDADGLRQKLSRYRDKHFFYLARWMIPADARKVMATLKQQSVKGVFLDRDYRRYYPAGASFAHVIGFAGRDEKGLEGLELQYDEELSAEDGLKLVLKDAKRRLLENVSSVREPRSGEDLVLSLDRRLQFYAYRALKRAVARHDAKSASLVMLDVDSGEVLAMVSQPSYNPNANRSNLSGKARNRAIIDTFEPGSTMKPLTLAAAMELGYINENSKIDTGKGSLRIGRNKVSDPKRYGVLDPAGVLRKSSNVGSATIALKMPEKEHWTMLDRYGFGQPVMIDFPGEVSGLLRDYGLWRRIDQASLAYGYSLSVSTLQLAQAYAILAADGIKRPLSLLRVETPAEGERVLSVETSRALRRMMEGVVSTQGTAPKAAVSGYRVAGKTGTVKKLGKSGYEDRKYRALFAGMAPASSPRLVIVTVFDEPRKEGFYGGQVAAPVFAEVMGHALRLLNVAPDNKQRPQELQMASAGGGQ
ncbi:MAG: penicillin-binding protein 2 [Pseudomonadota bacterium]